jgi:peptidoglycan/LPS O-acetylase OafA/YrhL
MIIGVSPTLDGLRMQRQRKPGLDLVRAVAIGWVMIYHANNIGLVPIPDYWFLDFGWMGVDLFFVLSGYLIASQLLRPFSNGQKPAYATFFSRRLLRTLPAYIVVVALYFLVPVIREQPLMQPFWQFATFTENLFFDISQPKAFSHVWSLCVEEQFYIVFPIAVVLLFRRPSARKAVLSVSGLLAFGMAVRAYLWLATVSAVPFDVAGDPNGRHYMTMIYYPTWSRLDGLLAGISIAAISLFRPLWWARLTKRPNILLIVGIFGMAVSIFWFGGQIAGLFPTVFAFPLLAASIALIVAAASDARSVLGRFTVPGARTIATGAYSLYLTQKIAYHLAVTSSIPPGWLRFAFAVGLAGVLGAALYWGVERPFLKLRDRLDGRTRTPLQSVDNSTTPPISGVVVGL